MTLGVFAGTFLAVGTFFFVEKPSKLLKSEREKTMFVLPPNFMLLVCAAIVFGIIGFVIYGFIKGFENIFPNE